ncbi:hypothetical protein B0J11DRAFT_578702 [Dendryphion nanum]|uniref:Rhodopsin domain-containing protein n=1 Tax=Dendryphion nanum TaxID=256645 RepID=A0A9P9E0N4_9PLEO|nr:hypothetical protein B0J11DRAFT_578702 [Dendryphion nanum]
MWENLPNTPEFLAFMQTSTFLKFPAMVSPKGVIPNLDNPSNLRQPYLAVLQLFVVTLAVAVRAYIKIYIVRKTRAEDYWLLISWVAFVGFHVVVFRTENLPLGVHQWDMTIGKALKHAKLFHIGAGIYAIVMLTVKIAIILQIRTIFIPHQHTTGLRTYHRYLRLCIDATLAVNVLYYVAAFVFQCDLIIIVVPQPVIWSLRMERRKQLGLSVLFGLGALALASSIARLHYTIKMHYSEDKTYYAALMGKWSEPELTCGFLAICLPVLPAFIKKLKNAAAGCGIFSFRILSPTADTDKSSTARRGQEFNSSYVSATDTKVDVVFSELGPPVPRKDSCGTMYISQQKGGSEIAMNEQGVAQLSRPEAALTKTSPRYIPLNPF